MFRTVPLYIIRSFSLCTQQWYMSYRFADSLRVESGSWSCSQAVRNPVWHIPLLCVQWKTPDDGQRNCPKHVMFHFKNTFEKLAVPFWSCSQAVSKPLQHIPLLCVQWKTPDDGQRNCPKHVEFHSKNEFEKLVHLVGLIRNIYCHQYTAGNMLRFQWTFFRPVLNIQTLCIQWLCTLWDSILFPNHFYFEIRVENILADVSFKIYVKSPISTLIILYYPFKDEAQTALFKRPSPYRAVKVFHLGYKNQSVYAVSGTSRCLFSDNHLKTKRRLLYLKTQSVPRCKHFSSRL